MLNVELSNETNEIILNQTGYRTEVFSGSGIRNLEDVISYEISDLGNSDIVLFCNNFYNLNLDLECDVDEDDDEEDYREELDMMIQENYMYYLETLLSFIEKKLNCHKSELKGLWLAKEKTVKEFYLKNLDDDSPENYIDEYRLPSEYLIISDLGYDGVLLAYK